MNKIREIRVHSQDWNELAKTYSGMAAAGQKGNDLVRVKSVEHKGFLYTSFSVRYTPEGHAFPSSVRAYRLFPPAMFAGETTTICHDEKAILAGRRQRGDATGLIVSVNGTPMVCAQAIHFLKDESLTAATAAEIKQLALF